MITNTKIRSYTELKRLQTFEERFQYLQLKGTVAQETFGYDRYINQSFYRSREWKRVRDFVILRDNGCDLGIKGYEIPNRILIHHMNPISIRDLDEVTDYLMDPEYLICVTHNTHNAIHYGDMNLLPKEPIMRRPNDTCPWKK